MINRIDKVWKCTECGLVFKGESAPNDSEHECLPFVLMTVDDMTGLPMFVRDPSKGLCSVFDVKEAKDFKTFWDAEAYRLRLPGRKPYFTIKKIKINDSETKEYRCTRSSLYPENCLGYKDLTSRQGHYIRAKGMIRAFKKMEAAWPDDKDGFTIQDEW